MEYAYDLGSHSWPVTTSSAEAQRWFDRGLVWCYGFNHEEGLACFRHAVECDPACAMAYWGEAYAIGPNYNKNWDAFEPQELVDAVGSAHTAIARARDLARSASRGRARADRGALGAVSGRHSARGVRALERRVRRCDAPGVCPPRRRR